MADEKETKPAEVENKEAEVEESSEKEEKTSNIENKSEESDKIDYEELLRKEREKAKAEAAYEFRKKQESKSKNENWEDEELDEDNKPLTRAEMRELLREERQATEKTLKAEQIREVASNLAGSDAERDLIIERHKNRVFPDNLDLREQLEEVYGGIHSKRIIGQNNELKRALANKSGNNTDASGTYHETQESGGNEPKIAADRKKRLANAGFKWNNSTKQYERELPNGGKQVHDLQQDRNYYQSS